MLSAVFFAPPGAIILNGRSYIPSGGVVTIPAVDVPAARAQFRLLMWAGSTADRPTYNPATVGTDLPQQFYDQTLSKPVFPVPGTNPVQWVDITGSAA